ncbi:hypothetical protein BY996DRAFT_6592760 [Phakopsora pachyrhizi]|nr:hypothetical protein BY996DRAFT_6592760 [Phakopsora pachyrhizi]
MKRIVGLTKISRKTEALLQAGFKHLGKAVGMLSWAGLGPGEGRAGRGLAWPGLGPGAGRQGQVCWWAGTGQSGLFWLGQDLARLGLAIMCWVGRARFGWAG